MAGNGWLKRLFGGGESSSQPSAKQAAAVEHKGYRIVPAPRASGSQWNVAGIITRPGDDGAERRHAFVRADNSASWDEAVELTVIKAKQMIDIEGERIFDKSSAF